MANLACSMRSSSPSILSADEVGVAPEARRSGVLAGGAAGNPAAALAAGLAALRGVGFAVGDLVFAERALCGIAGAGFSLASSFRSSARGSLL